MRIRFVPLLTVLLSLLILPTSTARADTTDGGAVTVQPPAPAKATLAPVARPHIDAAAAAAATATNAATQNDLLALTVALTATRDAADAALKAGQLGSFWNRHPDLRDGLTIAAILLGAAAGGTVTYYGARAGAKNGAAP
jgi:uncharacterized protein YcfJ